MMGRADAFADLQTGGDGGRDEPFRFGDG
ncbi:MAG: hypothetical protein K0Q94_3455, partial [Paenibacillus sp.]|nr:hypothetical protein [Paenibacillus sp.]